MDLSGLIGSASSNKRSWAIVGVLVLLVAAVAAYLVISLLLAKRRAAELLVKNQQLDEKMKQLLEDQKLASMAAAQDLLKKQIYQTQVQIDSTKEEIRTLDDQRAKFASSIDGLTSWKDLQVSGPSP
jgi:peptidoglycan hydrolase CwlO-like protein